MYNPTPDASQDVYPDINFPAQADHSIYIPVGKITWQWYALAKFQNGSWVVGSDFGNPPKPVAFQSKTAYAATKRFPVWEHSYTDIRAFQPKKTPV